MKVPLCVGIPLIVIVLEAHDAVTPEGRPVAVPMPVAPVVVWVSCVSDVLIHKVGEEDPADTVFPSATVIVPVADIPLQPPDSGML